MQPFSSAILLSGTIHRPDQPRTARRSSRLSAGKGISGPLPAVGNQQGRGILSVISEAALEATPRPPSGHLVANR